MEAERLRALLIEHDIPLHLWGTGNAKTFDHLVREISLGEGRLEEECGELVYHCRGAGIHVYYHHPEKGDLVLKEDRQVFADGRVVRREFSASIGEKLRPNEKPPQAAYRAHKEELGIDEHLELIPGRSYKRGPSPSRAYPGLLIVTFTHLFSVWLPERHYRAEGYVEHQSDKSSYFIWQPRTT